MIRLAVLLLLSGVLLADDPEPPRRAALDLKQMQGDWDLIKAVMDGRDALKEMPKGSYMIIKKNQITFKGGPGGDDPATIKLDPTKKPPHIDISPRGEVQVKGIYKLEKDRLTIAFTEGKDRPKSFDDKDVSMIVLKRRAAKK